jgi:hypothetical protein
MECKPLSVQKLLRSIPRYTHPQGRTLFELKPSVLFLIFAAFSLVGAFSIWLLKKYTYLRPLDEI